MNSFVMSLDLMRGQIGSHLNDRLFIRSFMMTELKNVVTSAYKQNTKIKFDQQ